MMWKYCTNSHPFTTRTHLIVEAAGCVEIHAGVESAGAHNAAVVMLMDNVHNLGHRVLVHLTAHFQLQVRLACNLSVVGGVRTEDVGVHNSAILKLFEVEDIEK